MLLDKDISYYLLGREELLPHIQENIKNITGFELEDINLHDIDLEGNISVNLFFTPRSDNFYMQFENLELKVIGFHVGKEVFFLRIKLMRTIKVKQ